MTPAEYGEVRDVLLHALDAVEAAVNEFFDLASDHLGDNCPTKARAIGPALVEYGSWIGGELESLLDAQEVLQKLVGKALQRPGISVSAMAIYLRPQSARARSATTKSAVLSDLRTAFIVLSSVG